MRRLVSRRTLAGAPLTAIAASGPAPTAYVADTMRAVLHAFFLAPSFEDCLVATVNLGGDADTTGAIAGAIAGAHFGLDAIPRRWVKRLDRALVEELAALSDRLVDLSPLGRGGWPVLPTGSG